MTRNTGYALESGEPLRPRQRSLLSTVLASDWTIRVLTIIGIFAAWEFASRLLPRVLMPSPATTFTAFAGLIESGELVNAWLETAYILGVGLGAIAVVGVFLGVMLGRFRPLDTFLDPVMSSLFIIPKLALLPIVALWFGFQEPAKIVYIFLFGFFEVMYVTRNGVRAMEAEYVEVARSYAVSERKMLTSIVLPAAVPYVITGLRLGLLRGIEGAVIAGFLLESNGIGGLIFNAGMSFRPELLFAGMGTVAVLGISINVLLHRAERHVAPWSQAEPA